MKLVKLAFPPGVYRNGTTYQAMGRWLTSDLVRWYEGAMQPVGGWLGVERSAESEVAAAISDDGGVFTDETADANDADTGDVVLIPATPAVDDAFYVGYIVPFHGVTIDVTSAAVGCSMLWEYWNGSDWVLITQTVVPAAFSSTGTNTATFGTLVAPGVSTNLPADWEPTTVNSQGPFYYVRARVTTAGSSGATAATVQIDTASLALQLSVGERVCGMLAWRDNDGNPRLALGTPTKAYTFIEGALTDITPSGFTTGGDDASLTVGNYGAGLYGSGSYGAGDTSQGALVEANTWRFDNFGELLVGCALSDGTLYSWDLDSDNDFAAIAGAPTNCVGLVVTPERFLVALGADGDKRTVAWADQESLTDWTSTATNQAGDFPLSGSGQLMAGKRGRNETLLWTDTDLWAMRYVGGTLVYSFAKLGSQCGAVSRRAMEVVDSKALWMGSRAFFIYDGFVRPIPCDVSDYVFGEMNKTQASKIVAVARSEFSEVWWFYPSAGSEENDRYVAYNYADGFWMTGNLQRTAGVDRGPYPFPILCDASGGVWDHERGDQYEDPDGNDLTPNAESGPFEIGDGDVVMDVLQLIPDDRTVGDVQATFYTAFYPDQDETTRGPYTLSEKTDVRFSGRQVRMKVEQVNPGWRVGVPRLGVVPGGRR